MFVASKKTTKSWVDREPNEKDEKEAFQVHSSNALLKAQQVVDDDDFDYDGDEIIQQEKPANNQSHQPFIKEEPKANFKKFLPSKDEMRKKNYIGESIIAEREDEYDPDDPNKKPSEPLVPSALGVKRSRIAKLCDESLKDYKEQKVSAEVQAKEKALL
jgi:hypothetical protein